MESRGKKGNALALTWLSLSILDSMLGHIHDAMLPKEAWDSLVKLFAVNTKDRKLQLKIELNTLEKGKISVNEYALKIMSICESHASINVKVEDDDKVEIFLRGLGPKYKSFKTSILTRDNIPTFADLVSMLVVEERNQMDDETKETQRMRGKPSTIVLEEVEEEAMEDLVQQEPTTIVFK